MIKFLSRDKISTPVGQGVVNGIMEVCYIGLVALFMTGTNVLFGNTPDGHGWFQVFSIVAILSLLVLSVAVSAVLVFGWPAHYFLEKKYKEGVSALIATVASMFVIFAIILIITAFVSLI